MIDHIRPSAEEPTPLLEVSDLVVEFRSRWRQPPVRAVDGVSLMIGPMETVGLVGESGSGKTTIGRAILGLAPVKSGRIVFDGRDITSAGYRERRSLSSALQAIFQDPYSSLNPARTIGQTLAETLRVHSKPDSGEVRDRVATMLERVGLPAESAGRYPAHFSGGQRQRIALARALMVKPRLVVCDEPLSALDLSVQAQVLNLLRELQHAFRLSFLFIAHDLAAVRHLSHRVVVLYGGRIMEVGTAARVYGDPVHPYTKALLDAVPVLDPDAQQARRAAQASTDANLHAPRPTLGCPFAPRCPYVIDLCRTTQPKLNPTPDGSLVACHRWQIVRMQPSKPLAATKLVDL